MSRSDATNPFRWRPLRAAAAPARARGFTLLELLVAIAVLALVSLLAWRGLDSLVNTRERLEPEAEQVRALLTLFGQLERDLAHVAMPEFFALATPPVAVRPSAQGPVLEIVRLAPTGSDPSTQVQTVFYRVEDEALLRQATPAARRIGPVEAEQLQNVRLLPQVRAMRVRVWRDGLGWTDALAPAGAALPPPTAPGTAVNPARAALPAGLEVVIERSDGRTYRRVLLVG